MISGKLALLALFAMAPAAAAQCSTVPGTGCPGIPPLKVCINNPTIGTTFCLSVLPCPACTPIVPVQLNVWFLGPPNPIVIPVTSCCGSIACGLYGPSIYDIVLRPGPMECYAIPNNPAAIGATLGLQPACLDPFTGCFDLAPALQVTIR